MNETLPRRLRRRKERIERRLQPRAWPEQTNPMFSAKNIHYDLAERTRGLACGGIGAMHLLARRSGLIEALDQNLRLLKRHLPYHESDHVLNIAYNILCQGDCLEDLERLRNDEVYLDALGAQRIPDPTTAGDFCRRFSEDDVVTLMKIINQVRLDLWHRQPEGFFEQAILDADGAIAPTTGECKDGMGLSYKGVWGYHPLLISLAWTLKAWFALSLPATGRWSSKHQAERETVLKMEFKKFRHAFVALPCQIVRTGRRIIYRLLSWNRWLPVFFRGVRALCHGPG